MQSSCTFHVPQLKFAKELEIGNYEHLKMLTLRNWKYGQVQIKKILFFTKIFGKLEIENYDKTQLNLLLMKRWKNLVQITNWYWKTENIENSNIYKKLKKLLFFENWKIQTNRKLADALVNIPLAVKRGCTSCAMRTLLFLPICSGSNIYSLTYQIYVLYMWQISINYFYILHHFWNVIRTQYTFCRGTFCCSPKTCHLTSIGKRKMKSAQAARPE